MPTRIPSPVVVLACVALILAACAPAAPTSPTTAPTTAARPAAQPTAAAVEAKPAGSPVASPSPSASPGPAASPASSPAGASPAQPAAATLTVAERSEVESFYTGKTLHILVGSGAGGGYDLFARLTAKYLPKYLPGAPTVVVENMTGAGGVQLVNTLYNVAPKDGTYFGSFNPGLVLVQAVGGGSGGIQFDSAQLSWLGSPNVATVQCAVRRATGVDSIEKLIASQNPIVFGATQPANTTSVLPALMRYYLNDKVKVVTGYDGVNKIKLAVDAGEADGLCGAWESLDAVLADWFKPPSPIATIVVKAQPDPAGRYGKDVPELKQFLKTEEAQQMLQVAIAPDAAGFVYGTTPSPPPVRLKALRTALHQSWTDPAFKDDADKSNLGPSAVDYQTVEKLVQRMLTAPPEVLKKTKEVLEIQ